MSKLTTRDRVDYYTELIYNYIITIIKTLVGLWDVLKFILALVDQ